MRRSLQAGEQQLLSLGNIQLTNARVLWAAQSGGGGHSVALQLSRVDGSGFTFVHKPLFAVLAVLFGISGFWSVTDGASGIGVSLGVCGAVALLAYLASRRFEVRISAGEVTVAVGFGGSRKAAPRVTAFLDQVDAAAWTARVIEARGQLPVRLADVQAPPP